MNDALSNNEASGGTSALDDGLCLSAFALYRPPFIFDHGYILDADSRVVADSEGQDVMLRVRGWGRISYLPSPEELQDKVGELIANALTEYWTRHNVQAEGAAHVLSRRSLRAPGSASRDSEKG